MKQQSQSLRIIRVEDTRSTLHRNVFAQSRTAQNILNLQTNPVNVPHKSLQMFRRRQVLSWRRHHNPFVPGVERAIKSTSDIWNVHKRRLCIIEETKSTKYYSRYHTIKKHRKRPLYPPTLIYVLRAPGTTLGRVTAPRLYTTCSRADTRSKREIIPNVMT